ncbi:MAG: EAL domain-containing protein [Alphaproteobacteria bacterium]|nr:EAL domain-containing protein [Alphaproteobacteria bacterium]
MMSDTEATLQAVETAQALYTSASSTRANNELQAEIWWLESEALTRLGRAEDAHPVSLRALSALGEAPENSKLLADIYTSIARSSRVLGEHGEALAYFQEAYQIYRDIGETRSESIALQSMASIYSAAEQYDRAIDYFERALERYRDPNLDLAAFNNLANALTKLGRFEEAEAAFEDALSIAVEMDSATLRARILNNIANMRIRAGELDAADAAINSAFDLVGRDTDVEWARFFYGVYAETAFRRGDTDLAIDQIARVFEGLDIASTSQNYLEVHGVAADIYAGAGLWRNALAHHRAFKRLGDERARFVSSANSALMNAQFDFTEQSLQIERLRNDTIEQQYALESARASQRLMIVLGGLALLVLTAIILFLNFRATRARARHLAGQLYEDNATGLPTRAAMHTFATQNSDCDYTVIAVKLNKHTEHVELLGSQLAAQLVRQAAKRISQISSVRSIFLLEQSVIGLVLTNAADRIAAVTSALQKNSPIDVTVHELTYHLPIDLGIGCARDIDEATAASLQIVSRASLAMHGIEAPETDSLPINSAQLMSRLVEAVNSDALELHYQPKLNLRSGECDTVEALCRWKDRDYGFVSPAHFIPVAERLGQIRLVTEWTIRRACEDVDALARSGDAVAIAVNLSGSLLADNTFVRSILEMLAGYESWVSFEITETAVIEHKDRAFANLDRLSLAGIKLSIDDYGTGLSSLTYLKQLPVQELKLDRSLVDGIARSQRDRLLVRSTIDLAHNLGLTLVAEGIEDMESLSVLQLMGCDAAQGYGIAKPLPIADLKQYLRRHRQELLDNGANGLKNFGNSGL